MASSTRRADPKVQLEQAIMEAQDQHRRLTEQAANVIANQKQTEMRLNRSMEELEKVNRSARQAVLMADDATKKGDTGQGAEYTQAAEAFANRLIAVEKEVESLKTLALQSTQAADQAKAAVAAELRRRCRRKLSERQKLLSQLDQAKMQEQMNKAMASLSRDRRPGRAHPRRGAATRSRAATPRPSGTPSSPGAVGRDPHARGRAGSLNTEAQARLAEIRAQLGPAARRRRPRRHRRGRPRPTPARAGTAERRPRRRAAARGRRPDDHAARRRLLAEGEPRAAVVDRSRYWMVDAIRRALRDCSLRAIEHDRDLSTTHAARTRRSMAARRRSCGATSLRQLVVEARSAVRPNCSASSPRL